MTPLGAPNLFWSIILLAAILWTFPWKGIALWQAARRRQLGWFIALCVINTVGVLEIVYIFFIAPQTPEQ